MKTSLILPILMCLPLTSHAQRAALLIGNADYVSNGHFHDLATTTLDARSMAGLMKGSGTFSKVLIRENATRLEMEEALAEFARELKPNFGVSQRVVGAKDWHWVGSKPD